MIGKFGDSFLLVYICARREFFVTVMIAVPSVNDMMMYIVTPRFLTFPLLAIIIELYDDMLLELQLSTMAPVYLWACLP